MQIGVVNQSVSLDPRDLAFIVEAWSAQSAEFCAAWGIPFVPVTLYQPAPALATLAGAVRVMTVQDVLDDPRALGYHDDENGVILARILADNGADSGSHECCEESADPDCDLWVPMGNGDEIAREVCDPVEGDSYPQTAEIGGDTRQIPVSNFVLPSYFDPAGKPPFDRMGKLSKPFSMSPGGYQIIRDASGGINDVFAQRRRVVVSGPAAHARIAAKLARPESRLLRRLRGGVSRLVVAQ